MGFDVTDILKEEFFKRFQRIKDKLDNVVKNELEKWLFEEKVQKLLKEKEEKLAEVTEYEIRELLKWGYSKEEIFEEDIIKEYRRLDKEINIYDDNEEEVKRRLNNYIETWKLTKEKEKDKEIERIVNNEDENENKLEKLINTDDFELFEESDSENLNKKPEDINKNNENDLSDYYIENLFEEINNIAAQQNQVREDMRQAFITLFGHDIGNNWNALVPPAQPIFGAINNVNAAVGNLQDPVNRAARVGSNVRFVLANGNKIAALGKTEVEIQINDKKIPIEVEVMDSKEKYIIIGNDILKK
jgi:hypothetical protein